jgi:hypothetical protein
MASIPVPPHTKAERTTPATPNRQLDLIFLLIDNPSFSSEPPEKPERLRKRLSVHDAMFLLE